ncbi:hypothetical protein SAMN05444680_12514 [Variovorax sp. YR216]|nr:hypothetical protein SAMN05444680_12514 [Variovorax sp. YR216]
MPWSWRSTRMLDGHWRPCTMRGPPAASGQERSSPLVQAPNTRRRALASARGYNRQGRTRRCNRVCMPMNELPLVSLQPKDAGHSNSHRYEVSAAANLRPSVLDLDNTCELIGDVPLDQVDPRGLSVAVVCGRTGQCLLDVTPTARIGAERVSKRHVLGSGEQGLVPTGVAPQDSIQSRMALCDGAVNAGLCHVRPLQVFASSLVPSGQGFNRGQHAERLGSRRKGKCV